MTSQDRLTQEEAAARAEQISGVSYDLELDLHAGAKTFKGDVTISFDHAGGQTFLEWTGGHIERFEVNGAERTPDWDGHRIALGDLEAHNELRVVYERSYDHTGEGFHQFIDPVDGSEYLYTQFEPYSAHRLMPCFDQPDLKAVYRVAVTAPAGWAVVSAGAETDREDAGGDRSRRVFAETVPFSTYLLSVCAGDFEGVQDEHRGIELGLYTRSSLMEHLDAEALFGITKRGIDFFEDFFDQPYPFGKYDQLFVPEFNWGGMENVAAVTYTDTVVFRDPPTQDQLARRAEYFMHELAHMWFGDLVTMRWWNDIWLNESFASYAGYLALEALGDFPFVWQDFNHRMKLWAYREDQLPTTHRIADDVASTDETFLNFDGITYGKGAAVLKQLVKAIGLDAFRSGLRTYFRRHRFDNATLADFLAALQGATDLDLVAWAARWLKTPSLNTLSVGWDVAGDRVTGMQLRQEAPDDHPVLRPHHVDIAVVAASGAEARIPASISESTAAVDAAEGVAAPAFVYPNAGDHGYAKIALDPASIVWAREHLPSIDDALLRQQVWASLWEMVRDRRMPSIEYLDLVRGALPGEPSAAIVRMVTATVAGAVGRYVPADLIDTEADRFVATARDAIEAADPGDLRVLWGRALIGLATTEASAVAAAALVDEPPVGLSVDQDMRWSVALRWVSLAVDGADARLATERARDTSDRGDRAMTTAEASRPDPVVKSDVWDRIHGEGYGSLAMEMAAANGFWRRQQADMLEPYVGRFFDGLPAAFAEREPEAAKAYYHALYPGYRIEGSTGEMIRKLRERDDLGVMLTRLLRESEDDLERALACRALAASSADGVEALETE